MIKDATLQRELRAPSNISVRAKEPRCVKQDKKVDITCQSFDTIDQIAEKCIKRCITKLLAVSFMSSQKMSKGMHVYNLICQCFNIQIFSLKMFLFKFFLSSMEQYESLRPNCHVQIYSGTISFLKIHHSYPLPTRVVGY